MSKEEQQVENGEQLELIAVDHPHAKAIKKLAGPYQRLVNERKTIKLKEDDARRKLVAKVKELATANAEGVIAVKVAGIAFVIKPDEKVKITFEGDEADGGE